MVYSFLLNPRLGRLTSGKLVRWFEVPLLFARAYNILVHTNANFSLDLNTF